MSNLKYEKYFYFLYKKNNAKYIIKIRILNVLCYLKFAN